MITIRTKHYTEKEKEACAKMFEMCERFIAENLCDKEVDCPKCEYKWFCRSVVEASAYVHKGVK